MWIMFQLFCGRYRNARGKITDLPQVSENVSEQVKQTDVAEFCTSLNVDLLTISYYNN
jgi:hypothetical protein